VVNTISYKPIVGILPNLQLRQKDELIKFFKSKGQRSK